MSSMMMDVYRLCYHTSVMSVINSFKKINVRNHYKCRVELGCERCFRIERIDLTKYVSTYELNRESI